MSKRSEEAALKAYPENINEAWGPLPGANEPCRFDDNLPYRKGFIEGFEQAEKELALTWEDIELIGTYVLELVSEERNGSADWGNEIKFYSEVLRRFNEQKLFDM